MSVMAEFYNYQQNPMRFDSHRAPFESCNPAPQAMRRYTEARWGMVYLGCHVNRSIRDGSSESSHAFGAAVDMRYQDLGLVDREIVPWLISTSAQTGLQAIHHYVRCSIWRPPGTSGRSQFSNGWQTQRRSGDMGASWASWLHLEFHPGRLLDHRSIEEMIGETLPPVPPPPPPAPPEEKDTPPVLTPGRITAVNANVTTVRGGSVGKPVEKLQTIMRQHYAQNIPADGAFGPATGAALANVQRIHSLTVDSVCGPQTWAAILDHLVD